MKRWDIIDALIKKYNYQSYLEIGLQNGVNFSQINCSSKLSVDPDHNCNADIHLPSDEFFEANEQKFDLIFIDGLHTSDQVYKDIINSLKVLKENGTIVCHDMNPTSKEMQEVPRQTKVWTGDCWRAWLRLRKASNIFNDNIKTEQLEMYVIDSDFGVGIIKRNLRIANEKFEINEEISYEQFEKNKKEWLNLITVDEFTKLLN